ncbi:recombinase family protein [Sorangium atrum]|uniref:Recombinase family protein n=1 Tax=Sorangium atrum TaxID=2995308 RepID=A0ABT5C659_9BACT|nr:recombinase family protein [Sorangium aterium]MDC0679004.1 recombinase family protein [Sorangium aterium]MDC0680632.1 recombinase family protein [Sorangium aterium]MDC0684054.1 recombinase family protein [Sorangium aterium]
MSDKIQPQHLERRAIVYMRQSTLRQVYEHPESTSRQYALQQRAIALGWPADRIDVIDEDVGQSATSAQWRTGFQRLADDVAHGRIGAIFALEVSRLARCSADWYRLLDLCGFADVILADEHSVYTPRDSNDRLLLGLKGTMSEAEQMWMRLRLHGGKLSKARRGELFLHAATGYEWDEAACRFRFDPDEHIQRAVRLVFERFRLDGSAYAVMRYFADRGLKMPARSIATRELSWVPPRHSTILRMLHNPTYAGAYVFGRHEERIALVDGQLRRRRVTRLTQEAWKTCIRDRHPAYIPWEEFMANQRKLHNNRTHQTSPDQHGAAREGPALLQGLALCGKCGHRMATNYQGTLRRAHYECRAPITYAGGRHVCWTVSARAIDEAVARLFLEAAHPPDIEIGLAVVREAERQSSEVNRQWKLRLERARYEARLAERRYKAVDPDNRVVARTLERDWNEKLREVEALEREHQEICRREKVNITDEDRLRILSLTRDLTQVWNAPSTTHAERKNLLRMLVQQVTLSPIEVPARMTRVQLLWKTGVVSDFTVPRRSKDMAVATPPEAIELIQELVFAQKPDWVIADELNRRGLRTGRSARWSAMSVRWIRWRRGLRRPGLPPPSVRRPDQRADGLYSIHGVAARFQVTEHVVRYWVAKGWLKSVEGGGLGRTLWFKLDRATIKRLNEAKACGYGPRPRRHSQTRVQEKKQYA